jgi:hypothetical protein
MRKKQFISLIFLLTLASLFLPVSSAQALKIEEPFGGIVSSKITCTCSKGNSWIWFTPLYLGGPLVTSGAIVYSPFSTILYADLNIGVPGKWHLGSYLPGVQACWIRAVYFCLPLPALGLMTKVGTN